MRLIVLVDQHVCAQISVERAGDFQRAAHQFPPGNQ
jgi:hypothetical protein